MDAHGQEPTPHGPTRAMPRTRLDGPVWVPLVQPVLMSALGLLAAGATASLLIALVRSTAGIELSALTPSGRVPAETFVLLATATQIGLVVGASILLRTKGGPVRVSLTRRAVGPTILAVLGVIAVNGVGSWAMQWSRETYRGLPEIPPGWSGAAVIVVAGGLAPVVEELFFREALLARVFRASPRALALVLTSVAFGFVHAPTGGPVLVIALTAMGMILGGVRLRTGSLAPPILAHAANNLLAALIAARGWD